MKPWISNYALSINWWSILQSSIVFKRRLIFSSFFIFRVLFLWGRKCYKFPFFLHECIFDSRRKRYLMLTSLIFWSCQRFSTRWSHWDHLLHIFSLVLVIWWSFECYFYFIFEFGKTARSKPGQWLLSFHRYISHIIIWLMDAISLVNAVNINNLHHFSCWSVLRLRMWGEA